METQDQRQVVTFITDFGTRDHYMGIIKGTILSAVRAVHFVDITHDVKSHDIVQAAFILKNVYSSFPSGTIHVVSVNNYYHKRRKTIVFEYEGQFFIGPDNGLFSLIFGKQIEQAFAIPEPQDAILAVKNTIAIAVQHITAQQPLAAFAQPIPKIVQRITLQPVINRYQIMGSVIHVDHYENCIVNVDQALFDRVRDGRKFALFFKRNNPIIKLSQHYYDVPVGEALCLFNAAGFLEIAVNMGKASSLLNLNLEDTVQIDFI